MFPLSAYSISLRNRQKKYRLFLEKMHPLPQETILDIGINAVEYSEGDNYLEKHYPHPENITAISQDDVQSIAKTYPSVSFIRADGKKIPFAENHFDISYSNAVIEHVGNETDQIAFLSEQFRVAKRGYLTTPNKYFPIEVHTRVPLLHLILSKTYFDIFLNMIGKSWATGNYMRLLGKQDLIRLLRKAGVNNYSFHENTFLGFTLTFTVIWSK